MGPQQLSVSRPRIILGRHIPPGLSAMPTLFLCSQGHVWEASGDAASGDTLSSRCPMCGAAGEPAEQENVADEQTISEIELNTLGRDGWELVGVIPMQTTVQFVFKRIRS